MYRCLLALALLFPLMDVKAEVEINGFANLTGGKLLSGEKSFALEYETSWDFERDSLFALQMSNRFTSRLSGTIQVISRGEDGWSLSYDWAYLSYQVTKDTQIKIGKQRLPVYMLSDVKDVGHTFAWVELPYTVYVLPTDKYTGVNLTHSAYIKNVDIDVDVIYGRTDDKTKIPLTQEFSDIKLDNVFGSNIKFTYGNWYSRISYLQAELNLSDPRINLISKKLVGPLAALRNNFVVENERANFIGVGATYDDDDIYFISEYTQGKFGRSVLTNTERSFYMTFGKYFGKHRVYFTYGTERNTGNDHLINQLDSLPENLREMTGELRDFALSSTEKERMFNIGYRYELSSTLAFKSAIEYNDYLDKWMKDVVGRFSLTMVF